MSAGRPGGLTALAIMNFIFGGYSLFPILGFVALLAMRDAPDGRHGPGEFGTRIMSTMGMPVIITFLSMASLAAILEVLAGFGYLRQKRFLGRVLGNAFALLSIAANVTFVIASRTIEGLGLTLGAMLGVLYPLMTLLLINATFREDLVN